MAALQLKVGLLQRRKMPTEDEGCMRDILGTQNVLLSEQYNSCTVSLYDNPPNSKLAFNLFPCRLFLTTKEVIKCRLTTIAPYLVGRVFM